MTDVFAADIEEAPPVADAEIKKVRDLAERYAALNAAIEELERQANEARQEFTQISDVDLPAAMLAARLEVWPMPGGKSIELANLVNASIPKDHIPEAHAWFEAHGHGDLIKRKITILFGRDEIEWAKKFIRDCAQRKKPLNLDQKEWIEPMTLGAFVREQLKEAAIAGGNPEEYAPTALLGVFKRTYARLVGPRAVKEKVRARR
jgi:hypothetical protein